MYFNETDLRAAEHKVIARAIKSADLARDPGANAWYFYYMGMIEGITALVDALTEEKTDG